MSLTDWITAIANLVLALIAIGPLFRKYFPHLLGRPDGASGATDVATTDPPCSLGDEDLVRDVRNVQRQAQRQTDEIDQLRAEVGRLRVVGRGILNSHIRTSTIARRRLR